MPDKIYYESFAEAVERNRPHIPEVRKQLEEAGVKYVLAAWIDLHGIPKTKPVPMSDFEELCLGKGPQFAVHSISYVPELSPADSDQVVVPDLDAVYVCPWDRSMAMIFSDLYWEDAPYNVCPRQARLPEVRKKLEEAGVKYVLAAWIDLHGIPKTKPVPMSDFEELCLGKGPQFAVHSIQAARAQSPAYSRGA